jgi:hypothetical protein
MISPICKGLKFSKGPYEKIDKKNFFSQNLDLIEHNLNVYELTGYQYIYRLGPASSFTVHVTSVEHIFYLIKCF